LSGATLGISLTACAARKRCVLIRKRLSLSQAVDNHVVGFVTLVILPPHKSIMFAYPLLCTQRTVPCSDSGQFMLAARSNHTCFCFYSILPETQPLPYIALRSDSVNLEKTLPLRTRFLGTHTSPSNTNVCRAEERIRNRLCALPQFVLA
jgi:hypothetical protein